MNMHPYRTHTCNQLRKEDAGKTVRLSGWMFRLRDHGGILFVDLRDHYGITQIVVHPSRSFFSLVEKAHLESVITVTGEVKLRDPETINPDLPTGEIEIEANELVMESASQVPAVRVSLLTSSWLSGKINLEKERKLHTSIWFFSSV